MLTPSFAAPATISLTDRGAFDTAAYDFYLQRQHGQPVNPVAWQVGAAIVLSRHPGAAALTTAQFRTAMTDALDNNQDYVKGCVLNPYGTQPTPPPLSGNIMARMLATPGMQAVLQRVVAWQPIAQTLRHDIKAFCHLAENGNAYAYQYNGIVEITDAYNPDRPLAVQEIIFTHEIDHAQVDAYVLRQGIAVGADAFTQQGLRLLSELHSFADQEIHLRTLAWREQHPAGDYLDDLIMQVFDDQSAALWANALRWEDSGDAIRTDWLNRLIAGGQPGASIVSHGYIANAQLRTFYVKDYLDEKFKPTAAMLATPASRQQALQALPAVEIKFSIAQQQKILADRPDNPFRPWRQVTGIDLAALAQGQESGLNKILNGPLGMSSPEAHAARADAIRQLQPAMAMVAARQPAAPITSHASMAASAHP